MSESISKKCWGCGLRFAVIELEQLFRPDGSKFWMCDSCGEDMRTYYEELEAGLHG